MSGPDQGAYSVLLDDHAMGPYTSKTDSASYDFLLFAAHELEDGPVHRLMIVSEDEGGGSLAFDVAVISSEVASGMYVRPFRRQDVAADPLRNPVVSSLPSSTVPVIATNSSALADNISTIDAAAPINPVGIPTQYSKAQLASLAHPYHFKWNGAAYFVVVFSSLVTAAFAILCIRFFSRSWIKKRQARAAPTSAASGINHLIPRGLRAGQGRKPRPTTRLLEALKGRKIGTPMPSDDGHSLQADRNSAATDLSFESGERDGTAHGW